MPNRKNILVAEDDIQLRDLLTAILTHAGYRVRVAEDGFSALMHIRADKPDIILSDLYMLGMSGFELLSVVRRRFPEVAVIAMSLLRRRNPHRCRRRRLLPEGYRSPPTADPARRSGQHRGPHRALSWHRTHLDCDPPPQGRRQCPRRYRLPRMHAHQPLHPRQRRHHRAQNRLRLLPHTHPLRHGADN